MKIKKWILGLLLVSFFSMAESDFPTIVKHPEVDNIARLTPLNDVRENVISHLVKGFGVATERAKEVDVIRLSDSDFFQIDLAGVRYTINADAKYWLKGDVGSVHSTRGSRAKESVTSNEMLEFNQRIRVFLMSASEYLPVYGDALDNNKVIFAFVDLSCPYCQQFHLVNRNEFEKKGFSFVYVPFVRNTIDKRVMDATRAVFCNDDPVATKAGVDQAYLNGPRQLRDVPAGSCSHVKKAIIESLLLVGHQMGAVGTPMFLLPNGEVVYGSAKLNAAL